MRKVRQRYSLGDLIAALFEEAKKLSTNRLEQKILVYAALKDLLNNNVRSYHPILLKA
ncbi:MAG TPA: hypothetical protein VJ521_14955 [Acidobacteriota bacterium]|nr:hypothetical protein [Acidobacteriota bacterium]